MAAATPAIVRELRRVLDEASILGVVAGLYLADETEARGLVGRADAVALPACAEDARAVVAWCYAHDVAVIPRGGGTGFAGGCVPLDGGVVLSLERLRSLRSSHGEDHKLLPVTAEEEKVLQAAARAALATGAAVSLHLDPREPRSALSAIDVLEQEGLQPDRIVAGDMDIVDDADYHLAVAARGVFVAYDQLGCECYSDELGPNFSWGHDSWRLPFIKTLVEAGHADQLLLSQDVANENGSPELRRRPPVRRPLRCTSTTLGRSKARPAQRVSAQAHRAAEHVFRSSE